LFGLIFNFTGLSQNKNNFFIAPEYMVGRVVPNYIDRFPNTHLQQALVLNLGAFTDTSSTWAKYYNFPQTGISLFYSNIGNNKVFGQQFSGLIFISYKIFNKSKKPYFLKLGMGASYFTTYYDTILNPRNDDIGSPYTWAFQAFLYKTLLAKTGFNLKAGIGFSHASNGHTQLPNLGLNAGLLSLSAQFYHKNSIIAATSFHAKKNKSKSYSLSLRQSLGFHEYGDEHGPVGTGKRKVYSTSLSLGKTINRHFKLIAGATYRYYEQYYYQITKRQLAAYIKQPKWAASNIVLFVGSELLMGHFSIDAEFGVNVYKPFYKQYNKDFQVANTLKSYESFKANFKRFIASRMGLNLFLFNTNKLPKHNFFVGAHIKANFGQADFSEFTFGYRYRIN